eukprot:scaffold97461_cov18-Tisochrysis_lutea.AAC.1
MAFISNERRTSMKEKQFLGAARAPHSCSCAGMQLMPGSAAWLSIKGMERMHSCSCLQGQLSKRSEVGILFAFTLKEAWE